MELSFRTNDFEGPLDLLLFLISKHKLNILDVQIVKLVDQYMECIGTMEQSNLEYCSEFLDMAARLVYIKTVMLLPKHEEEKEELQQELTGQLLEYKACKQVAEKLKEKNISDKIFIGQGEHIPKCKIYDLKHEPIELMNAFIDAIGRGKKIIPESMEAFSGIVSKRIISVSSRIIYILKRLYKNPKQEFLSMFENSTERSEMVATFLAVLELIKAKRVTVTENQSHIVFNPREKGQK